MRYDASTQWVDRPRRTPEEKRARRAFERNFAWHMEYGRDDDPFWQKLTPNTLHYADPVTGGPQPVDDDIYHPHSVAWKDSRLYGIFGDPDGEHIRVQGTFYKHGVPSSKKPRFLIDHLLPRNKKLYPALHEELKRLGAQSVTVARQPKLLGIPWTGPQRSSAQNEGETEAEQIQRMGAVTRRNAMDEQTRTMKSRPFPFAIWPTQKALPTWEEYMGEGDAPDEEDKEETKNFRADLSSARTRRAHEAHDRAEEVRQQALRDFDQMYGHNEGYYIYPSIEDRIMRWARHTGELGGRDLMGRPTVMGSISPTHMEIYKQRHEKDIASGKPSVFDDEKFSYPTINPNVRDERHKYAMEQYHAELTGRIMVPERDMLPYASGWTGENWEQTAPSTANLISAERTRRQRGETIPAPPAPKPDAPTVASIPLPVRSSPIPRSEQAPVTNDGRMGGEGANRLAEWHRQQNSSEMQRALLSPTMKKAFPFAIWPNRMNNQ